LYLVGIAVTLYGVAYTLRPLFNLFLVWLRRKQLFEGKQATTTIELKAGALHVDQGGESVRVPLAQVQSVQHRSTNTWILTHSDNMIYIPRQGLLAGNHDKFVQALEAKLAPAEDEESE
jgi:hypothetical protein